MTDANELAESTNEALGAARQLIELLQSEQLHITFMESCTGGMLAALLTSISGSSEVFIESSVTYANDAKVRREVDAAVIERYSVYSTQTAEAMARASLIHTDVPTIGVGVTGSLTRADPANADHSVPGQVFVGITSRTTTAGYIFTVDSTNRYLAKLHLATEIFQCIMQLQAGRL